MPLQRLDLRSVRYDRLSQSVLVNGRQCVIEISHGAIEAMQRKPVTPEEAVLKVVAEASQLARLASRLPPDDGKIHITENLLASGGIFGTHERE